MTSKPTMLEEIDIEMKDANKENGEAEESLIYKHV